MTKSIWGAANVLRGSIDVSEYKQYLIPLVFYKYLSDKVLSFVINEANKSTDSLYSAQKMFEVICMTEDTRNVTIAKIEKKLGYSIKPEFTFMANIQAIEEGTFQTEKLVESLQHIQDSNEVFCGIFEGMDLRSKKFGHTIESNNQIFSEVLKELLSIENMTVYTQEELGGAFEELITAIASAGGKKSGEFYSPHSINRLLTQISLYGKENQPYLSIYDPTMGSGSLLLSAQKYFHNPNSITFYGQELNISTYNLARMNMVFHGVSMDKQHLKRGDTLGLDWPNEGETEFDAVLMNPPYSVKWLAEESYLNDPRFKDYGVLAPKSTADYSFLLHGYHHLNDTGTMTILLPHGVLFRGGAEGKIRRTLLEIGAIDAIIGLPSNLLYGTGLPTTVIVLKKNRFARDILFIDASQHFEKEKNQNVLTEKNIKSILDTYMSRKDKHKYAHVATFEEIVKNDYNLNIPRYVDTFEEEDVSLEELSHSIEDIQKSISLVEEELITTLQNLEPWNEKKDRNLTGFIEYLKDSHKEF